VELGEVVLSSDSRDRRGLHGTTRAPRPLVARAFGPARFARLDLGAKPGTIASGVAAGSLTDGPRTCRPRNPGGSSSDEIRVALVNPRYCCGDQTASRINP